MIWIIVLSSVYVSIAIIFGFVLTDTNGRHNLKSMALATIWPLLFLFAKVKQSPDDK